jgi:flagellar biosynthesis protein FliQ
VAGGVALALAAPWIGAQLVSFTERLFAAIAA